MEINSNSDKVSKESSKIISPKALFFVAIILIFFVIPETSYSQRSRRGTESDTLQSKPEKIEQEKSDTTAIDTTRLEQDTIPPFKPIPQHGKISFFPLTNVKTLSKKDFSFINYTSLVDIIYTIPEIYPLSTGLFGNLNHFSIFGSMPDEIEFASNGYSFSIINPKFYNPSEFPVEFIENLEIIWGSKAVIFSKNSSALINLQSIVHNTAIPYTRLWFCESDGRLMSADVIYAQNFIKNWNISLGIRREGSDNRFESTKFDSWNFRASLRWNISENSNISLSENFSNYTIALNGGIDKVNSLNNLGTQDIFSEIWAKSFYKNVSEQNLRHDVVLTYTRILDYDTTSSFSSNLYFSYSKNILNRSDDIFLNENDTLLKIESDRKLFGFKAKYESKPFNQYQQSASLSIDNLSREKLQNSESNNQIIVTANYYGELKIFEPLTLSGGAKVLLHRNTPYLSLGSMVNYKLKNHSSLGFDISYTQKTDFFNQNNYYNSNLMIVFLKFNSILGQIDLNAFFRQIYNQSQYKLKENPLGKPITFEKIGNEDISKFGLNLSLDNKIDINKELFDIGVNLNHININFINQINYFKVPNRNDFAFPLYRGKISIFGNFISGRSSLNLGLNYSLFTAHSPLYLLQLERVYLYTSELQEFEPAIFGIFLTAKLGNAFVKINYDNILSRKYYLLSIYPERGAHLQFSLSWSFFN